MQTADTMVREKQINMRLSEEEAARLDFLTEHYGINTSALLRMLLKKEEDAVHATLAGRDPAAVLALMRLRERENAEPRLDLARTIDRRVRDEQDRRDKLTILGAGGKVPKPRGQQSKK